MKDIPLSPYGSASVVPAPVNKMMTDFAADFQCEIDINLGVGYVNEGTIPEELIEQAYREVVSRPDKYQHALNYGDPKGSDNLIGSIRRFLLDNNIGNLTEEVLDANRIVIGVSGATSLLESVAHILGAGTVVTTDPMYYIYCHFIERMGFEILAVPEDDDGIRTDLVRQEIERLGQAAEKICFLYAVTVNNPTCTIMSSERIRQFVEIAGELSERLGRKVPVFLDKAYENLIHDESAEKPASALLCDKYGLVYEIYTLSKVLAPALRIGYVIGADSPFLSALIQRNSDAGFSAPLVTQEIASYLLDHHVKGQLDSVNKGYRAKAVQTKNWIDELLGEFLLECRGGSAGFYYYLTFDDVETHQESDFFKFLTRTTQDEAIDGLAGKKNARVIYIPGEFCVHRQGKMTQIGRRQLRLSYGYEELDRIGEAVQVMREAAIYTKERQKG